MTIQIYPQKMPIPLCRQWVLPSAIHPSRLRSASFIHQINQIDLPIRAPDNNPTVKHEQKGWKTDVSGYRCVRPRELWLVSMLSDFLIVDLERWPTSFPVNRCPPQLGWGHCFFIHGSQNLSNNSGPFVNRDTQFNLHRSGWEAKLIVPTLRSLSALMQNMQGKSVGENFWQIFLSHHVTWGSKLPIRDFHRQFCVTMQQVILLKRFLECKGPRRQSHGIALATLAKTLPTKVHKTGLSQSMQAVFGERIQITVA